MKQSDVRRSYRTGMNTDDLWLEEVLDELIWYNKVHSSLTSGCILHVSCWLLFMEEITCWSSSNRPFSLCALRPHSCAASPRLSPTSPSTLASLTSPLPTPPPLCPSWPKPRSVRPPSAWPWTARRPPRGEWRPAKEKERGTPRLRQPSVGTRPSPAWLCPCVACWGAAALPPPCSPACRPSANQLLGRVAASRPSVRIRPVRLRRDASPSESKTRSRNWTLSGGQSCVSPRSLCPVFSRLKLIFLQSAVSTP